MAGSTDARAVYHCLVALLFNASSVDVLCVSTVHDRAQLEKPVLFLRNDDRVRCMRCSSVHPCPCPNVYGRFTVDHDHLLCRGLATRSPFWGAHISDQVVGVVKA